MPRLRAALCLALLALVSTARAASDAPLSVGTPGSFRWLFLDMPLMDARREGGLGKLDVRWWLSNDWSIPTQLVRGARTVSVQDDVQSDVLQMTATAPWARWGVPPALSGIETTAEVRLAERWGGWTDRPIERWHGLVGAWNFQRQLYPTNAVSVQLSEDGGRTLVQLHHPQAALGDVALRTQIPLLEGPPGADGVRAFALSMRVDVKIPTGQLQFLGGSGGVDAGLGLSGSLAPTPWLTVHLLGAGRLLSPLPHQFPLQPSPIEWGFDASVVVRPHALLALILEDRVSSPLFGGGWRLAPGYSQPEATAVYGLLHIYNQVSGGVRIGDVTIFFSEDFTPGLRVTGDGGPRWFYNSNAPDVVLGLSFARSY
jgi:hypothetical protein